MDTSIIIRPHGKMYIIGLIVIYAFLLGLLSFSVHFILSKWYWALLSEILPIVCLILQTRDVVKYKIKLTDAHIYLAAQREWFITRHKNLKISYKNLKSIQYFFGLLQARFVSAIALTYNDEKIKYLDVSRFSEKQVGIIMDYIVTFAQQYNSYGIEVLPDEIQKGFGQRKH